MVIYLTAYRCLKKIAHGSEESTFELVKSTMESIEAVMVLIMETRKKYGQIL